MTFRATINNQTVIDNTLLTSDMTGEGAGNSFEVVNNSWLPDTPFYCELYKFDGTEFDTTSGKTYKCSKGDNNTIIVVEDYEQSGIFHTGDLLVARPTVQWANDLSDIVEKVNALINPVANQQVGLLVGTPAGWSAKTMDMSDGNQKIPMIKPEGGISALAIPEKNGGLNMIRMNSKYFSHTLNSAKTAGSFTNDTFSAVPLPFAVQSNKLLINMYSHGVVNGHITGTVNRPGTENATADIDYHIIWTENVSAGTTLEFTIVYEVS